jgi:hypothetical protein
MGIMHQTPLRIGFEAGFEEDSLSLFKYKNYLIILVKKEDKQGL